MLLPLRQMPCAALCALVFALLFALYYGLSSL